MGDLKRVLNRRSKAELVALLLDIFSIYPELVDDLKVTGGVKAHRLEAKVAELFGKMQPWGHLSEDQVEAHLRLVAREAERLAEQGQTKLARKVYYAMILGCVNLHRDYGGALYFSANIPFVFAEAYDQLAAEQIPEQGPVIKAEVEELYRELVNPEALALDEALGKTWEALLDHGFVEG